MRVLPVPVAENRQPQQRQNDSEKTSCLSVSLPFGAGHQRFADDTAGGSLVHRPDRPKSAAPKILRRRSAVPVKVDVLSNSLRDSSSLRRRISASKGSAGIPSTASPNTLMDCLLSAQETLVQALETRLPSTATNGIQRACATQPSFSGSIRSETKPLIGRSRSIEVDVLSSSTKATATCPHLSTGSNNLLRSRALSSYGVASGKHLASTTAPDPILSSDTVPACSSTAPHAAGYLPHKTWPPFSKFAPHLRFQVGSKLLQLLSNPAVFYVHLWVD